MPHTTLEASHARGSKTESTRFLAWVITELAYDWVEAVPVARLRSRTQSVILVARAQVGSGMLDDRATEALRPLLEMDGLVKGPGGRSYREAALAVVGELGDELAQRVLDICRP